MTFIHVYFLKIEWYTITFDSFASCNMESEYYKKKNSVIGLFFMNNVVQNFNIENCFEFKITVKEKQIGSSAAGRQEVPTRYFLL